MISFTNESWVWSFKNVFIAALWNRAGHCIFALWFLSSSFFLFLFLASSQWSQIGCLPYYHTWCGPSANLECRTQKSPKNCHLGTIAQLGQAISSQLRHVLTIGKKLLNSNISPTCPYSMVNFGLLAAEIVSLVWGTPANFNGFRVLAALMHGTLVVGVSDTLLHWTEGATYIRQGVHHVGCWPTF